MRRRVWVIRGGEDNRLVDDFVATGVIGIGYPDVPDGRWVDRYDVTERLRARGWTAPEARAEMFDQFVREIGVGHLVVMPDPARREVVIGRIEGDYEFIADIDPDDDRHRRRVTWIGRHGVGLLPAGVRDLTRQRTALSERSSPALVEHAEAVERGELGRDAHALDVVAAPRPTTTRATRTPRAPAVKAAPRPVPPAGRACPSCYLVKQASLFPDGSDVCIDCQ